EVAPTHSGLSDSAGFWDRFSHSFVPCANQVYSDQFYPYTALGKNPTWETSTGTHAATQSVLFTLRESFANLPMLSWIKQHQSNVGDLVANSVDNIGEESVSPLDPTYRPAEVHWWQSVERRGQLEYGVRPFLEYAYVTMTLHGAGHVLAV